MASRWVRCERCLRSGLVNNPARPAALASPTPTLPGFLPTTTTTTLTPPQPLTRTKCADLIHSIIQGPRCVDRVPQAPVHLKPLFSSSSCFFNRFLLEDVSLSPKAEAAMFVSGGLEAGAERLYNSRQLA
ncbi:unnamed protein product [Lampetra planeri]